MAAPERPVRQQARGSRVSASEGDEHEPSTRARPAATGRPHVGNLQNEMISALRGTITGVMAKNAPAAAMPELDLDFSVPATPNVRGLPVLRAEPERSLAVFDRKVARQQSRWGLAIWGTGLAVAGVATGLTVASWHGAPPAAQTFQAAAIAPAVAVKTAAPIVASAPVRNALDAARDLMADGRITQARALLLNDAAPERSAADLMLARSYDPNFLSSLAKADAAPDIAEARRWYQRWYERALKEGAVPQTMRLDLLLRSLDKAAAP